MHCVAGLGRAPLLVAIALIEAGIAPIDAVDFIRSCRRGAFNALQLKYIIDTYKKRMGKNSMNMASFGSFLKRAPSPPKTELPENSTTTPPLFGGGDEPGFFRKMFKFGRKNTP